MTIYPFVRVVVLNYDGGEMTLDCLDSLDATKWPKDQIEIVVVDNGSVDGIADRIKATRPHIRVLEPFANLGFAGGCNLGITAVGAYDFVALINNDATVDPHWLAPLVEHFNRDEKVGAVSPKLLFADSYVGVRISRVTSPPSHDGDEPSIVWIHAAESEGKPVTETMRTSRGLSAPSGDPRTGMRPRVLEGPAEIHIPAPANGASPPNPTLRLLCSASRPTMVRFASDEFRDELIDRPRWIDVPATKTPYRIINNFGSSIFAGWHGGDVRFCERDTSEFDTPELNTNTTAPNTPGLNTPGLNTSELETTGHNAQAIRTKTEAPCSTAKHSDGQAKDVFAWCGGAVLLSKKYINDVGVFDERFFLYYEDTDLAWRGRNKGWRHIVEPTSVVFHRHGGSGGETSSVFRHYVTRNRLLLVAKHAPLSVVLSVYTKAVGGFAKIGLVDIAIPLLRARRPVIKQFTERANALRAALRLTPAMLLGRRREKHQILPALLPQAHSSAGSK